MTYYPTPFGNGVLTGSGGNVVRNVKNQFGARDTGGSAGPLKVAGNREQFTFEFTGADFAVIADTLVDSYLPAGAVLKEAYVNVTQVFNLTGTTPSIKIGTDTSEATNGFTISEAQLEALGTYSVTSTLTGTWAVNTPLAARTKIGVATAGTAPVVAATGFARITIIYERPALGV